MYFIPLIMVFSWGLIPMSVLFKQLSFFDVEYSTTDCYNYFYFLYFLIYCIGTSIKWTKSKSHFIGATNSLLNTNIFFSLFFIFLVSCLANSNCSLEGVYSMNLNSSNRKCTIQSLLFICSAFSYLITQKNWISTKKILCITW